MATFCAWGPVAQMDESASLRSLRSQVQILPGSYEISNLRFQIPKRRSGGTGRRAASRASWETFPWRFKSSHPHQTLWGAGMADREDAADLKLVGGALWPVGGDGYHAGLSIQRPRVRFRPSTADWETLSSQRRAGAVLRAGGDARQWRPHTVFHHGGPGDSRMHGGVLDRNRDVGVRFVLLLRG